MGFSKQAKLAVLICSVSSALFLVLLLATGTTVLLYSLIKIGCLLIVLAGAHLIYTYRRPEPLISAITGGLSVTFWAAALAGMIALAALRTGAPFIDASLARADAYLGFDVRSFIVWAGHHRWASASLWLAYVLTVPVVFASIPTLALLRRIERMWELVLVFSGSSLLCAIASSVLPAAGTFVYFDLPVELRAQLPEGAGTFAMPVVEAYRSGMRTAVSFDDLEGVVTFPSFHAAMALMTAFAFRGMSGLSPLAWTWCAAVLLSTIPIGGHYLIDLIAGAMVWGGFTLASAMLAARAPTTSATASGL